MSRFGKNPFYNPAEKSFYKFNPTSLTWVNARRAAWDQGGALVSLSNRAEGRWLWQNVISSSSRPQQNRRHEDFWIGLTIPNRPNWSRSKRERSWYWLDGSRWNHNDVRHSRNNIGWGWDEREPTYRGGWFQAATARYTWDRRIRSGRWNSMPWDGPKVPSIIEFKNPTFRVTSLVPTATSDQLSFTINLNQKLPNEPRFVDNFARLRFRLFSDDDGQFKVGGARHISGNLYEVHSLNNLQSRAITFRPKNDIDWSRLRNVRIELEPAGGQSANLTIDASAKQAQAMHRDLDQLNLANGAWETFNSHNITSKSVNNQSINPTGINGALFGKFEKGNFRVDWETYLYIPKSNIYDFQVSSIAGSSLTIDRMIDGAWTSVGVDDLSLTKGDILRVNASIRTNTSLGSDQFAFQWKKRSDSQFSTVPSAHQYLSSDAAKRLNQVVEEREKDNKMDDMIFLFSTKNLATEDVNTLEAKATKNPSNFTGIVFEPPSDRQQASQDFARYQPRGSTQLGDDYRLSTSQDNSVIFHEKESAFTKNPLTTSIEILRDDYAESDEENIQYELVRDRNNKIRPSSNNSTVFGVDPSSLKQTLSIQDNAPQLKLSLPDEFRHGVKEGELAWFNIDVINGKTNTDTNDDLADIPLIVAYEIDDTSTATSPSENTDYVDFYAPRSRQDVVTKIEDPKNRVPVSFNASDDSPPRLYIPTIADDIVENVEDISIRLLDNVQESDQGFKFHFYSLAPSLDQDGSVTLQLKDNKNYKPGIVFTPANRTGNSVVRSSRESSGGQKAYFDFHLRSKPQSDVTVHFSVKEQDQYIGNVRLTHNDLTVDGLTIPRENWDQSQRITLEFFDSVSLTINKLRPTDNVNEFIAYLSVDGLSNVSRNFDIGVNKPILFKSNNNPDLQLVLADDQPLSIDPTSESNIYRAKVEIFGWNRPLDELQSILDTYTATYQYQDDKPIKVKANVDSDDEFFHNSEASQTIVPFDYQQDFVLSLKEGAASFGSPKPEVSLVVSPVSQEGNDLVVTASVNEILEDDLKVKFKLLPDNSAVSANPYSLSRKQTYSLKIKAGQKSGSHTISLPDNDTYHGDQLIDAKLVKGKNSYSRGSVTGGQITLPDDDKPGIRFSTIESVVEDITVSDIILLADGSGFYKASLRLSGTSGLGVGSRDPIKFDLESGQTFPLSQHGKFVGNMTINDTTIDSTIRSDRAKEFNVDLDLENLVVDQDTSLSANINVERSTNGESRELLFDLDSLASGDGELVQKAMLRLNTSPLAKVNITLHSPHEHYTISTRRSGDYQRSIDLKFKPDNWDQDQEIFIRYEPLQGNKPVVGSSPLVISVSGDEAYQQLGRKLSLNLRTFSSRVTTPEVPEGLTYRDKGTESSQNDLPIVSVEPKSEAIEAIRGESISSSPFVLRVNQKATEDLFVRVQLPKSDSSDDTNANYEPVNFPLISNQLGSLDKIGLNVSSSLSEIDDFNSNDIDKAITDSKNQLLASYDYTIGINNIVVLDDKTQATFNFIRKPDGVTDASIPSGTTLVFGALDGSADSTSIRLLEDLEVNGDGEPRISIELSRTLDNAARLRLATQEAYYNQEDASSQVFQIDFDGYLFVPTSGAYVFDLPMKQGQATLKVDDVTLIQQTFDQNREQLLTDPIPLQGGQFVPIHIRYQSEQPLSNQSLDLKWKIPGTGQPLDQPATQIPQAFLSRFDHHVVHVPAGASHAQFNVLSSPSNLLDQPESFLVKPVDDTSSFCKKKDKKKDCKPQSYRASDYFLKIGIHSIEKGCNDSFYSSGDLVEFDVNLKGETPFDRVIPAGTRLFFESNDDSGKSDKADQEPKRFTEASLSDFIDQEENYIDLLADLSIEDGISSPTLANVLIDRKYLDDSKFKSLSYDYLQKGNSSFTIKPVTGELLFSDSQQRHIGELSIEASTDISAKHQSDDKDADMMLVMHRAGRTELLIHKLTREYFAREIGDQPLALLDSNNSRIVEKNYTGWNLLAVSNADGVHRLLWRNNQQDAVQTWLLSTDGQFVRADDLIELSSNEIGEIEEQFSIDLNSNKNIGDTTFELEDDVNTIQLATRNDKYYTFDETNRLKQIKKQNLLSQSSVWNVIGISRIDLNALDFLQDSSSDFNEKKKNIQTVILQQHKFKQKVRITPVDDNNRMDVQKSREISLNKPGTTIYLEYLFERDLDNDQQVSRYDYDITLQNDFRKLYLLETQTSQFLSAVHFDLDQIYSIRDISGVHITKNSIPDYQPVNLASDNNRNYLLWKHSDSTSFKVWILDQNWQQAFELELVPTSSEFLSYELIFNSDLNDDGVIGETGSKILYETSDYILSLNPSNQSIEVFARDGLFHQLLNKDGSPVYQGDQENHVYKAIEEVDRVLQLLVYKPSLEQYNLYKIDDQWRIDYLATVDKGSSLLHPFNINFSPSISVDDHQFIEQQGDLYLIKEDLNRYSTLNKDGFIRKFANQIGIKNNSDATTLPSILAIDTFFEDTTFNPVLQLENIDSGDYNVDSDVITSLNPDQIYQTYAIAINANNDSHLDLWKVDTTSSDNKKWFLSEKLWTAEPESDEYYDAEISFKVDFNNDNILGLNDNCFVDYKPIHKFRNFTLLKDKTSQRLAFSLNNGAAIALKDFDDQQILQNSGLSNYKSAISLPSGNFALYTSGVKEDKTYFIADFDQDWNFVQSSSLNESQLLETFRGRTLTDTDKIFAAESLFNIDIDLSQDIGSSDINLTTDTPYDFVVDEITQRIFVFDRPFQDRILLKDGSGLPYLISSQVDRYPIAAGIFAGKNTLIWSKPNSSSISVGIFSADWHHKRDISLDSSDPLFQKLESALRIDLNANADINNDLELENETENVSLYVDQHTRIYNVKARDGSIYQLKDSNGAHIFDGSLVQLDLLSAVSHQGSNYLLLDDLQEDRFLVWPVDRNWKHKGSQSVVKPNSSKARTLEERFAFDLTNDGLIGNFKSVNSTLSFELLINLSSNKYYIKDISNKANHAVDSLQKLVFKKDSLIKETESLPLAAAMIDQRRALLFKSVSTDDYRIGFYDDGWESVTEVKVVNNELPEDELYKYEKKFGFDLNDDFFEGSPYVSLTLKSRVSQGANKYDNSLRLLHSNSSINLYQNPTKLTYLVGASQDTAVPLLDSYAQTLRQNTGELLNSKSLIAVGQSEQGTNIGLLIDHSDVSSGWPFLIAKFDDNWRFDIFDNSQSILPSHVERIFNFDTDGNGVVGVTGTFDQSSPSAKKVSYRTVQSNGNLTLLQDELSRSYAARLNDNSPILLLDYNGESINDHTIKGYSLVALSSTGSENQLLFFNPVTKKAKIWTYDDSWTLWLNDESISDFNSQDALDLESFFQFDLNNDGYLGGTFLPSGTNLHFSDSQTAQNVDVTIKEDLIVNGSEQTFTLPKSKLSSSVPLDSVDGLEGFISSSSPVVVIEEGERRVLRSLRLNAQPHSTVVVGLESDQPDQLLLRDRGAFADPKKKSRIDLVFTPDNWNEDQFFSLHALDNDIVDGDQYAHIYNSSRSDDYRFDSSNPTLEAPNNLPVLIRDNDSPGVHLTLDQDALNEASTGIVYASLTAQPSDDVFLSLIPPTASRYDLKLVSDLKLASEGESEAKYATVSLALKNSLLDQYHSDIFLPEGQIFEFSHPSGIDIPLRIERDLSLNPGFSEFDVPVTVLTDTDYLDDKILASTRGLTSQIDFDGAEFKIANKLRGETADVQFNSDNWDIPQAVEIEAIDDNFYEDVERGYLRVETTSDDQNFNRLDIDPLAVDVIDDDLPSVSLELISHATEGAEPGQFRIRVSDPVPASVGNKGLIVTYKLSNLSIDERIYQPDCNNPLDDDDRLNSILQYPSGDNSSTYQIRIPPGHSVSESFVIPFDDYVADIKDKKFTIEIVENDDSYAVDGDNISMEIRNDDNAGLILLYSGDNLRVSEVDQGAQMLVMLASQPTNNVVVHIDEELAPQSSLNDALILTNIRKDFNDPDPSAVLADLQFQSTTEDEVFLYHDRLVTARNPNHPEKDFSLIFNNSHRLDSTFSSFRDVPLRLLKENSVVSSFPSRLVLENQQPRNQLGSANGSPFSQSQTFTPSDWHIPRTFTINSYDDSIIEDRVKNKSKQLIEYDPEGNPSVKLNESSDTSARGKKRIDKLGKEPEKSGIHPANLVVSTSSDDSDYNTRKIEYQKVFLRNFGVLSQDSDPNFYRSKGSLVRDSADETSRDTAGFYSDQPVSALITPDDQEPIFVDLYFDKPGAFGCNATIDDVSFRLDRHSINENDLERFDALIDTEIDEIQILSTEPRLSDISMPVEVLDTPLPDEFTDAYLTAFSDIQDSLESLSLPLAGSLSGRFDEPTESSASGRNKRNLPGDFSAFGSGGIAGFAEQLEIALKGSPNFSPENIGELIEDVISQYLNITPKSDDEPETERGRSNRVDGPSDSVTQSIDVRTYVRLRNRCRKSKNQCYTPVEPSGSDQPASDQTGTDQTGTDQSATSSIFNSFKNAYSTELKVRTAYKGEYELMSIPLSGDFGVPMFGMRAEGKFTLGLEWEIVLDLNFIMKGKTPGLDDFYISTEEDPVTKLGGTEISLTLKASVPGSKFDAMVGPLSFAFEDKNLDYGLDNKNTSLDLKAFIGLNGAEEDDNDTPFINEKQEVTRDQLTDFPTLLKWGVSGDAFISMAAQAGLAVGPMPNLAFDLFSKINLMKYTGSFVRVEGPAPEENGPTVLSVRSGTADGIYEWNENPNQIVINVVFSEAVLVNLQGRKPELTLETGSTAQYVSGDGSDTLSFLYNISENDTSADLNYQSTSSLVLNGSTIKNSIGDNANLKLPGLASSNSLAGTSNIIINPNKDSPKVLSVIGIPAERSYTVGDEILIGVQFTKKVKFSGTSASLQLQVGSNFGKANLKKTDNYETIHQFSYIVQKGDTSDDLNYANRASLRVLPSSGENAASFKDEDDNDAILKLPELTSSFSLAKQANIVINTSSPTDDIDTSSPTDDPNDGGTQTATPSVPGSQSCDDLPKAERDKCRTRQLTGCENNINNSENCKKDVSKIEGTKVGEIDNSNSPSVQDQIRKINNQSSKQERTSNLSTHNSGSFGDQESSYNRSVSSSLARYTSVDGIDNGSSFSGRPLFNIDGSSPAPISDSYQAANQDRHDNTRLKYKGDLEGPGAEVLSFQDVKLELDSAMSDIMGPTVKNIDDSSKEVYSVLDFLYGDIPVFKALSPSLADSIDLDNDKKVTTVDLISWLSAFYKYKNPKRGAVLCNAVARMTLVTNLINKFFSNVKEMAEVQRKRDVTTSIERHFDVVIRKYEEIDDKPGSVQMRLKAKSGMTAIQVGDEIRIWKVGKTSQDTPNATFKITDKLPAKSKISLGSRDDYGFLNSNSFADEIILSEKIPLKSLILPNSDDAFASYKLASRPFQGTRDLLSKASSEKPVEGKVDVPNLVIELTKEAQWEPSASSSDENSSQSTPQSDSQETLTISENSSATASSTPATSTSSPGTSSSSNNRFSGARKSALSGYDSLAGTNDRCDLQKLGDKLANLPVVDPSNLVGVLTGGNQFAGKDNVLKVYSRAAEKAKPSANISEETNRIVGLLAQLFDVGFDFPLVTNPMTALGLLTGKDVDLVTWHAPGMNVGAGVQYSFPLLATPVRVDAFIGGELNAATRMGFGFDSSGMRQWLYQGGKAEDFHLLANGFYIADRWSPRNGGFVPDPNGTDLPEVEVSSSVGPGISLNAGVVRGSIQGGLLGQAQLDLIDNGEITGQSDGRIRADEMAERIVNPPDFFALSGSVNVFVRAFVEAGFDAGFFQQWFTVWEQELARITLFEFGIGGTYADGSAANDPLKNVNVFFDGNSNAFPDSSEPLITSNQDASYHFRVDHTDFDANQNGVIDFDEGRLIAYGGIDSGTELSQDVPFIASVGDAINPLSTLVRAGRESGLPADEIDQWIRSSFDLGNKREYLLFDPLVTLESPEQLSSKEIAYAVNDYVAHIKTHFALDAYSTSLQDFLPSHFANQLADEIDLIKDYSFALFDQPSAADVGQSLASAVKQATLQQSDALPAAAVDDSRIVGNFVADVIVDFSQKVDESLGNVPASGLTSSQANVAVVRLRELKKESLQAYRDWSEQTSSSLSLGEYSSVSSAIAANCDLAEHFPSVCNQANVSDTLL